MYEAILRVLVDSQSANRGEHNLMHAIVRGSAVAVALAAATAGTIAGFAPPASAVTGGAQFMVETGFSRSVPVRTGGHGGEFRALSLQVVAVGHRELDKVKVAVDATGIKGFGELAQPAAGCAWTRADHLHESCNLGNLLDGFGNFQVGVRATTSAKAGQSGQVVFKVTSSNATEESFGGGPDKVGVGVADGPDIAMRNLGASYRVKPGQNNALPLTITNVGSQNATDPVVFVHDNYQSMSVLGNHSNCVYTTEQGHRDGAQCTFPGVTLKPGETMRLSDPFALSVPAHSLGDEVQYGADLAGASWIGTPPGAKPGTGAPVTLVPGGVPAGAVRPLDDIDPYNGLYYTNLATGFSRDLAAVTWSVHAKVGRAATIAFGVENSGTEAFTKRTQIGPGLFGTVGAYLYVPSGVTVLSIPKGCRPEQSGPDAARVGAGVPQSLGYACVSTAPLARGRSVVWKFVVRAAKPVSAAPFVAITLGQQSPTENAANDHRWAAFTAVR